MQEQGVAQARSEHEFRGLVRWIWPYVRPSKMVLAITIVGMLSTLAIGAIIPLQVEDILHHGEWDPGALLTLVVLIVGMLVISHLTHSGAHRVSLEAAARLRNRVYAGLLSSPALFMRGLGRSSVVARHTLDVDNVAEAAEETLASGVPGVLRIFISLYLLWTLEPGAAYVMVIASVVFLIVRSRVGRGLLAADAARLESATQLGQAVDETVTGAVAMRGLRLFGWSQHRFAHRVENLEHKSHAQGRKVIQMITGAHVAGLLGLLGVVVTATIGGHDNMAAAAAALLYVEAVVAGLEALPPWIRAVHLAVASQRRIDEIIAPAADDAAESVTDLATKLPDGYPESAKAAIDGKGCLIGLVVPNDIDVDSALTSLTQAYGGVHVPADTVAIDASPAEYLRAAQPGMDDQAIVAALEQSGLARLAAAPDLPIGPSGNTLSTAERQRLGLAVALASEADMLALGPLLALADPDTADGVLSELRETPHSTCVITARTTDVAEQVDCMLFVTGNHIVTGSHAELLVRYPEYSRIWEQRLSADDVDLSALGLGDDTHDQLRARLVTERFLPGEAIYREGDAADRVIFIISGRVEVTTTDNDGKQRRAAVLGAGNHIGDLRLTVGEKRAESAFAVDDSVVRSLSRDAISAGMMGLLDRSVGERRIVASILREGPATQEELRARVPSLSDTDFKAAIDVLLRDGALTQANGRLSAVQKRTVKAGAAAILDRLGGL